MKIRLVEAEFFLADGQTGMTKPIAAFRNFVNAPKNLIVCNQLQRQFIKKKSTQDATMYQNFFIIIPYLYEAQHASGDTPPIIRSLKLHWQPLVFHTWKVVGRVILMMGGVLPETC